MGDRDVPFDKFAICDGCGAIGAFDFMGDFFCAECIAEGENALPTDEDEYIETGNE